MKKRTAALFVFNGYEDWGPALALGLLRSKGNFTIKTFSIDGEPVLSAGGLVVQPSCYLDQLTAEKIDLLILPGGDAWQEGQNRELLPLVDEMLWQNKPVAAIGSATLLTGTTGDNIITAQGSAMVEFAVAIAAATGCMEEEKLLEWAEPYQYSANILSE